jgi:hypothetical protein
VEFDSSSELDHVVSARFPFAGLAPSRAPDRSGVSGPPLLGFLLPRNATTSGAPAHPAGRRANREGEECHLLAGAVLRVLAPLDGSGRARGTSRALAELAVTVAPRRLAALFHAARASLELPFRAFPSRGAVPALASHCFLTGSRKAAASAAETSVSRRFRRCASSLPEVCPKADRDARAGTTVPRDR